MKDKRYLFSTFEWDFYTYDIEDAFESFEKTHAESFGKGRMI